MKIFFLVLLLAIPLNGQFSRESCLSNFNKHRQGLADYAKIPNMNQLEYSVEMEKKILEQLALHGGCPSKYTIVDVGDVRFTLEAYWNGDVIIGSLGTSNSTEVACAIVKCMETGKDVVGFAVNSHNEDGNHLKGPPGSQCPPSRVGNSNGLCEKKKSKYQRKGVFGQIGDLFDRTIIKGK